MIIKYILIFITLIHGLIHLMETIANVIILTAIVYGKFYLKNIEYNNKTL